MHKQAVEDMYENGMLKEVYGPSHNSSLVQLLKYVVRINARLLKKATPEFEAEADELCCQLIKLSVTYAKQISSCLMCLIYCAKYYAAKSDFTKALKCFDKYFELESLCNPRFNVHCWATYNYARAVNAYQDCPKHHKEDALSKCYAVLQSKDVMNKSLKDGLNRYKEALKSQNTADL